LIRERFKIMGEVRTFSAQGRLTGYILTAVPVAMGFILSAMNWDYMSALFKEKIGHYMLAGGWILPARGLHHHSQDRQHQGVDRWWIHVDPDNHFDVCSGELAGVLRPVCLG
jgi:hypothetical protein